MNLCRLDLTMYCNKDCQCKEDLAFTPVVAVHARLVYFSPCHAGCTANSYVGDQKVSFDPTPAHPRRLKLFSFTFVFRVIKFVVNAAVSYV